MWEKIGKLLAIGPLYRLCISWKCQTGIALLILFCRIPFFTFLCDKKCLDIASLYSGALNSGYIFWSETCNCPLVVEGWPVYECKILCLSAMTCSLLASMASNINHWYSFCLTCNWFWAGTCPIKLLGSS